MCLWLTDTAAGTKIPPRGEPTQTRFLLPQHRSPSCSGGGFRPGGSDYFWFQLGSGRTQEKLVSSSAPGLEQGQNHDWGERRAVWWREDGSRSEGHQGPAHRGGGSGRTRVLSRGLRQVKLSWFLFVGRTGSADSLRVSLRSTLVTSAELDPDGLYLEGLLWSSPVQLRGRIKSVKDPGSV